MIVLTMNRKNGALTQYTSFAFRGAMLLDGEPVFVGDNGVYTLDSTSGAVTVTVDLPKTDLDNRGEKRIRRIYGSGQGSIVVAATSDRNETIDATIEMGESYQKTGRSQGRRDVRGKYYQFSLTNPDGADFILEDLDVVTVTLGRKPT